MIRKVAEKRLDEISNNKKEQNANHYDQIGWLITSFFLIFLGTMLPEILGWVDKPESTDLVLLTIFLIMFFGFLAARLFLRSQMRKMKIYGKENQFILNSSIWIYVLFILFIEIFLTIMLYKIGIINSISLVIVNIIVILFFALILLETKNIK